MWLDDSVFIIKMLHVNPHEIVDHFSFIGGLRACKCSQLESITFNLHFIINQFQTVIFFSLVTAKEAIFYKLQ